MGKNTKTKLWKGNNSVITYDIVMLLALCTSSRNSLSALQALVNFLPEQSQKSRSIL